MIRKMKVVSGENLDKRYGNPKQLKYEASPYMEERHRSDGAVVDRRVFLSAQAQRRWLKNKRRRIAYRERHVQ